MRGDEKVYGAGRGLGVILMAGCMVALLGGCISVKAPDKPIEINLNVKIQQEVVVRLQKDAQDLIQNNPELFPE
ncbi:MAG: YnbE family lipoprotein [Sphingobium sp.]|nr:YnbE family lipoprotein [Sphingobium sp.]